MLKMCAVSSVHGGMVGTSVCFVKLLIICSSVYITCIEYMLFCFLHWPTNLCDDMGLGVLMLKMSNKRALGRLGRGG